MTLDAPFRQAGVMRTDMRYETLDRAELPRSRHMPWLEHDLTPFEELAVPPLL